MIKPTLENFEAVLETSSPAPALGLAAERRRLLNPCDPKLH